MKEENEQLYEGYQPKPDDKKTELKDPPKNGSLKPLSSNNNGDSKDSK